MPNVDFREDETYFLLSQCSVSGYSTVCLSVCKNSIWLFGGFSNLITLRPWIIYQHFIPLLSYWVCRVSKSVEISFGDPYIHCAVLSPEEEVHV